LAVAPAAAATKLANNFAIGCALEAMSEAFSFVRKFDVPPQILYEVMTEGLLAAPVYRVYGKSWWTIGTIRRDSRYSWL
jgi:3-hydroxyisobutyrate dehydrogenase-like beta-hydroxyacid dehydrogenase